MAHTRKKVFDGLYAQLEETDGQCRPFLSQRRTFNHF